MKSNLWIVSAAAASSGLALAMTPSISSPTRPGQKIDVKTRPPVAKLKFAPPQFASIPPPAYTGNPDATLTIKQMPDGTYFDHIDSSGTEYSRSGSPYFVVDIVVPASYKGPSISKYTKIYGQMTNWVDVDTSDACSTSTMDAAIYKRLPMARNRTYQYTLVTGGPKKGIWTPATDIGFHDYCDSGISNTFKVPTTESKKHQSVVYRVMVKPKLAGIIVPATVGWHWDY